MPCLPLSSPPPGGTPAEKLDDPMPKEQKNANFQRLLQRQNQISGEKHQAYVGKTLRCLVDGQGRTAASPPAPPGAAGPPGGGARRHRHLAGSAGHRRLHLGAVWGTGGPVKAETFAGPLWKGAAVIGKVVPLGPSPGGPCDVVSARSRAGVGTVLRTLRVVGALPVPRGAAPGGPPARHGVPISPEKWGERRGAKGQAPGPPFFRARSLALARFGGCGALFRWWGCFGVHLRALIWIRILREQGLGEKAFLCGVIPPTKASPGGKLSPEVTDEGRPGCPTEQKKNAVEATAE